MNFRFKLSRRLARMKLDLLIAGTLLVLGCNITSPGPEVIRIDRIDIAPGRFTLMPFQSAELDIVVLTSRGDSGGTDQLSWWTSGGVITGNYVIGNIRHVTYQAPQQPGSYFLVVTTVTGVPADSASFTVTTSVVPVNAITVTPGSVSLAVADTATLRARLTDSTGSVLVGRAIEWSSSDNGIVQVLATGQVRAMAAGSATITATCEAHTVSAVITVNP
jgi:uncharacterized protein YjdB